MCEPLVDLKAGRDQAPYKIAAEVRTYLQTLLRLYCFHHELEAMDLFIVMPLMLMSSDCVDSINAHTPSDELEILRATLILVAQGLYVSGEKTTWRRLVAGFSGEGCAHRK